ncbi:MAG: VCBS repeat-containing protein [Kiritimatiellota bacterium]|nr:VCBS repeat-containing protein [Kiritimatiellota bacterium]
MKAVLMVSWLAAYFFIGVISLHSANPVLKATISVKQGSRIYDDQLAGWIENIIGSSAKQLVVLTECFGGNAVNNFTGGNTAVASATSPGEKAEYGAYDNAAAGALKPGAGRTAQNIQNAGTANKAKDGTENPSKGGGLSLGDFSLEDTSANGGVQSRHIIVYAGKPSDKGHDNNIRDKIKGNFAGQQNTTVKTAGGAGTSQGWDNPGTAKGLRDAIIDAGVAILNAPDPSKEQFIIFITDHGDLHNVETVNEPIVDGGCVTVTDFPTFTSENTAPGVIDKATPGFSAFIPFSGGLIHTVADDYQPFFQQGQWIFSLASDAQFANPLVLTNFTELYDEFNNNIIGDLSGEGVTLFFPVDSSVFTNRFFNATINMKVYNLSGAAYTLGTLSQDSGDVPKGTSDEAAYTALAGDFDGDGKADPAKYLETNGTWQVMLSGNEYAITRFTLGGAGYIPVAGDFDGDGKADPAVVEESTGDWRVLLSGGGYSSVTVNLDGDPDRPVTGDFDGDRKADPAQYNMSTNSWKLFLSDSGYAPYTFNFGGTGYIPVVGDFDGDGRADPAVYNETTGNWTIMVGEDDPGGIFGGRGCTPLMADFDGDGKADPAIYTLTTAEWQALFSGSGYMPVMFIF